MDAGWQVTRDLTVRLANMILSLSCVSCTARRPSVKPPTPGKCRWKRPLRWAAKWKCRPLWL